MAWNRLTNSFMIVTGPAAPQSIDLQPAQDVDSAM